MKPQNRRNDKILEIVALTAFLSVGMTMPAQAYIGPGLGVAMVWMLLGPVAAIVTTVALIAYFPLRYLYKKRQHKKQLEQSSESTGSPPGPETQ